MHVPRKRFGQHFLHDPHVIERIIAAIDPQPKDAVVEIGPGLGALTWPLLERLAELEVIEIDRDATATLAADPRGAQLRIYNCDVLGFDFTALALQRTQPLRIVGNLPYNISTPLLFKLLDVRQHVRDMHFMLQKEVVDRMAAAPGTNAYGRLTVMLAPWVEVVPLFDIGPGAFRPPPKVRSTYVRVLPRSTVPFDTGHMRAYSTIVAAAFGQRRKTLRNALKPLLSAAEISAAGIDPALRAEVITPQEYGALARMLAGK